MARSTGSCFGRSAGRNHRGELTDENNRQGRQASCERIENTLPTISCAGAPPVGIRNCQSRRSRESGNPGVPALQTSPGKALWIPAFAGMTGTSFLAYLAVRCRVMFSLLLTISQIRDRHLYFSEVLYSRK